MGRDLQDPDLSGIYVLLVEDHDDTREVLSTMLAYARALVLPVGDAEAAVRCAARVLPDVVLADLALPGRSGYWLLTELQRIDPSLPVALLTSYTGIQPWAMKAGFSAVLEKPVATETLWATVARLARDRWRPESGPRTDP